MEISQRSWKHHVLILLFLIVICSPVCSVVFLFRNLIEFTTQSFASNWACIKRHSICSNPCTRLNNIPSEGKICKGKSLQSPLQIDGEPDWNWSTHALIYCRALQCSKFSAIKTILIKLTKPETAGTKAEAIIRWKIFRNYILFFRFFMVEFIWYSVEISEFNCVEQNAIYFRQQPSNEADEGPFSRSLGKTEANAIVR